MIIIICVILLLFVSNYCIIVMNCVQLLLFVRMNNNLLWNQAGDAGHQRRLDSGLVRRHAQALQQVLLAQALRGGVHGTVLRRQHGVPLRVPQGAVDPVQQPVELALVQLQLYSIIIIILMLLSDSYTHIIGLKTV
jgi:hypothetical protein